MRKIKYSFTIIVFCTLLFICYKAISANLISYASGVENSNDNYGSFNKLDTKDIASSISDESDTKEGSSVSEEAFVDNGDSTDESSTSTEAVSSDSDVLDEAPANAQADTSDSQADNASESADNVQPEAQISSSPDTSSSSSSNASTSKSNTSNATKSSTSSSKKTTSSSSTTAQNNSSTTAQTPIVTAAPVQQAPVVAPVVTTAPIVIPTIYTPSAPGQVTYASSSGEAIIDASNTSQGYVSVKYTGSNVKVKVQIIGNGNTYNYDLPSSSAYTTYPLQFGNGTYSINVLENISGTQYMSILYNEISVNISNSSSVYLYPNQFVWFTQSSAIVSKSAEICAGLTKDIDKVSAIFKYISSNITYDYSKASTVQSGYLPNVDTILSTKTGICFDYAALFAAMCRAQGIPCKLVTGYVSPNNQYHAWNEVYVSEQGYIADSIYLSKIGYNRVDTTFYANMSSSSAGAYIGNGSNYSNYKVY